jgi:hypothetical protein
MLPRYLLSAAILGGLSGCSSPTASQPASSAWFIDVTKERELDFRHDPGPTGSYFLPQVIGSGAALIDFNNDGRLDIYLLQNAGPESTSKNQLFQQLDNGRFRNVSEQSGLDYAGYCMGAYAGDVNNDGWPDLYVTQYGGGQLFLNQGGERFERAAKSGIDSSAWETAASFCDYDRDGWLDLVIVNYLNLDLSKTCTSAASQRDFCHPLNFSGTPSRLYHNQGKQGDDWLGFEDRTEQSGLGKLPASGLGLLCMDLDGDRWTDFFVTVDAAANHAWINRQDGTFAEEAVVRGLALSARGEALGNMGVADGDVDGNKLADLFVTHLTNEQHSLWKQGPVGLYRDQIAAAGLTQTLWHGTGFGTVLADFDNNRSLDLAIVNGRVIRASPPTDPFWNAYAERNQLLSNDGTGKFRDLSASNSALCGEANIARGLAIGDLNNDGALDLLVTRIAASPILLQNSVPERGHWLMIRAVDPELRRDAIGATISIKSGEHFQQRLVQPGRSYLCSNDHRAHFGLGSEERVDELLVVWPQGDEERFECPGVDRVIELRRGAGIDRSRR